MKNRSKDIKLSDCSITIRTMQSEDVKRAAELEKAAFSKPWSEASLLSMTDREDALYVVAETDGILVGMCGVINACGDGDVGNVTVEKSFQGKGIAKAMLQTLFMWGQEIGVENYTLEVRAGNQVAINLYESLGFKSEGIRPGFYDLPREDAMIMWKRQETDG